MPEVVEASNKGAAEAYSNSFAAAAQLFLNAACGVGSLKFGGAKFSGREIERRETDAISDLSQGSRKLFSSELSEESAEVPA